MKSIAGKREGLFMEIAFAEERPGVYLSRA
jgi:hypothetical protein